MELNRIILIVRRILPKNRFARGVSVLVGGTTGAHMITILAAPLLTRLYQPEDQGLLAVFTALIGIIGNVSCLRYQAAIPLPDNDVEADALFILSFLIVILVVGLSAMPILLFPKEIAQLLNTPKLADYLILIPLGVFFIGMYNIFNVWAIRNKEFIPVAKTKLSQSAATTGIQLVGASFGPVALLVGQVAGNAVGSLSYFVRIVLARWRNLIQVRPTNIYSVACLYKRFPLFSTWSTLFNTIGTQLPAILFAVLFGPAVAGIYALANRVLSVPMQLLGQSIADVFFSGAAEASREGRLEPMIAAIHSRLAHIAMPPILVLLVGGPDIFALIFGFEWKEAGLFAQWLAPWLYLAFITSTLSSLFAVLDKHGTLLLFEAVSLLVRALAIIVGARIGDVITAVAFLAVGSVACRAFNLLYLMRLTGNRWREIWEPTLRSMFWAVPLASPIIVTKLWGVDYKLWPLAIGTAGALILTRYVFLMREAWA